MATEAHGNTRKNKFNEVRSDKAVGAGAWMGNSLLCVFAVNFNIPGAHGASYVRILKYFCVLPWPLLVFSSHLLLLTFYFITFFRGFSGFRGHK